MDLSHINKFYQYLVDDLLYLIMTTFFQIQILQLLILCMDDQEFVANLGMLFHVLLCKIIKVNHSCILFIILLHLISSVLIKWYFLVSYAYVSIESIDFILWSSFELQAILLISFVKTFCFALLNICCLFNINILFLMNSLCFLL